MGRPRELHRILCTLTLVLMTGMGAISPVAASGTDGIMHLADVERGQVGYGLSVFEGRQPERFEIEVIGVWKNVQPGTSYILARLAGKGLEESGVIAGMSGSPVFIEDRLVGAVAFAWPFAQQAIAGITPIESMRKLVSIDTASQPVAAPPPADLETIALRQVDTGLLRKAVETLRPVRMGEGTAALQWTASGFGASSRKLLQEGLGGLASAGQTVGLADPLAPGTAVAAVLIDGDLRLASSGTVTDRDGDTVLAFGHTFMGLGPATVPMASAEVVTVVSSLANSFKVTNLGEIVGAFDFDHAFGIRGRVGKEAAMIPLQIRLRGQGERVIKMRLADVDRVTPILVAVATLGALDSATDAVGGESMDMMADIDLGSAGRLQIDQTFDGPSAGFDAALFMLSVAGYLLQNNLHDVDLESIDLEIDRHTEARSLRLVGAHAARSVVRPGETVALNFDLVEYRGGAIRKSVEIEMPTNLPAGRYSLLVGDGVSIDAARLAIEPIEPHSFEQALEFLNSLHSRRELMVIGVFGEPGLSVAGEAMPRLPASLRSLWGAAPSGSARPLSLAIAQQQRLRLPVPLEGILRIDLEVERRRPWSPGEENGAPSAGQRSRSAGSRDSGR